MTFGNPLNVVAGGLSFLVALIFAIAARINHQIGERRMALGPLARQSQRVCWTLALIFLVGTALALVPSSVHRDPPAFLMVLYVVADLLVFTAISLFRHMTCFLSIREEPPSREWLLVNYGSAVILAGLAIALPLVCAPTSPVRVWGEVAKWSYVLVMLALTAGQVARLAQVGAWRAGVMGIASRSDVVVIAAGAVCIAAMVALHALGSWAAHDDLLRLLGAVLGLIVSIPFAVRNLGAVIAGVLNALGLLAGCALVYLASLWLAAMLEPTGTAQLAIVFAALGLLLVFGPGQTGLRAVIDRVVFRGSRYRAEELRQSLRSLSPELGAIECSRRAVDQLIRTMGLDGGVVVFRDGGSAFAGRIDSAALEHIWPRGEAAERLTDRPRFGDDLSHLPLALRYALSDQDVLGVLPLHGSRGFWGHLLIRTNLVNTLYREEDASTTEGFADQLARLLDAADLLLRALEVERSLAHAEKLAAIGELAARIAHEIRNPITAARSLAQQLSRETNGAFGEEHGLIVEELERVERQVADLLRYAKRDELTREKVDLAALVRETVGRFRARLDAGGVRVEIETPAEAVISADREKMRQVLINLIENATDALAERRDGPRLAVEVSRRNGSSLVRVSDNGPGVPAESLARIFDPFFSLKPKGTGLGLAIVKRTIEAHGGRIEAQSTPGSGISFSVELPDGGGAREAAR